MTMKQILSFVFLMFFAAGHEARGEDRAQGSGIVYAAPNMALLENPTSLVDAQKLSLHGMWRLGVNRPSASVVGGSGSVGLGVAYRQEGGKNADGVQVIEGGAGAKFSILDVGVTVRSVEHEDLDADLGARIHLNQISVGAVARSVDGSVDRWDLGLGVELNSQVTAEFNLKKPRSDSNFADWLYDVGLVFNSSNVAFSVGFDGAKNKNAALDDDDGGIHAGVSYNATGQIFLEGYYRPFAQEWIVDKWAAGVRALF
jgi:hypothetical protein